VPNIVGVARFTYGFHRTGAKEGIIFDIWLGAESFANICTDIAVILLLRKAYTNVDASALSQRERMKIAVIGAPFIVFAAFCKLYYTTKLYDFYISYEKTTTKADEAALLEALVTGTGETLRGSGARYSGDTSTPRRRKTADKRFMKAPAKSQTRSGRLQPQSLNAEHGGTTIIPTRSRKLSGHSRRQSLASEFYTTTTGTVKGKSASGRKAKQLVRTIDDAVTVGQPPGINSPRQSDGARDTVVCVQPASEGQPSVTVPDLSTLPDHRNQPASAGTSVKRPLAVLEKSRRQTGASAFTNAQLLAKILARRKATGGTSAGVLKNTDVTSRPNIPPSSAATGSSHPSSDVPQPLQPEGGDPDPCDPSATSQVQKSSGQLPEEPLLTYEAGATSPRPSDDA
ncbi:hypothetical protein MTO96_034555, partial [Rhipicephalus appendiculatus]